MILTIHITSDGEIMDCYEDALEHERLLDIRNHSDTETVRQAIIKAWNAPECRPVPNSDKENLRCSAVKAIIGIGKGVQKERITEKAMNTLAEIQKRIFKIKYKSVK